MRQPSFMRLRFAVYRFASENPLKRKETGPRRNPRAFSCPPCLRQCADCRLPIPVRLCLARSARHSVIKCGLIPPMAYLSPNATQRALDLAGIDAACEVAYWFARNYPDEREERLAQIDSLLDVRLLITSGRYP